MINKKKLVVCHESFIGNTQFKQIVKFKNHIFEIWYGFSNNAFVIISIVSNSGKFEIFNQSNLSLDIKNWTLEIYTEPYRNRKIKTIIEASHKLIMDVYN